MAGVRANVGLEVTNGVSRMTRFAVNRGSMLSSRFGCDAAEPAYIVETSNRTATELK
jgi:hypothetical protein